MTESLIFKNVYKLRGTPGFQQFFHLAHGRRLSMHSSNSGISSFAAAYHLTSS